MRRLRHLQLTANHLSVDVRLVAVRGRWIASADAPEGPTLGLGRMPHEAVIAALEPYDGFIDELLESLPDELYWPAG